MLILINFKKGRGSGSLGVASTVVEFVTKYNTVIPQKNLPIGTRQNTIVSSRHFSKNGVFKARMKL